MERISELLVFLNIIGYVLAQSTTNVIIAKDGGSILDCTIPGKSAGDVFLNNEAAVSWKKYQEDDSNNNPDELRLNNGAFISQDLSDDLKTRIAIKPDMTGDEVPVSLQLTLTDAQPEDSGKYICKVDITGTSDTYTYTYIVQVIDPIDEVIIYSNLDANSVGNSANTTEWTHQQTVTMGTKTQGYLACVVRGAYPLPTIHVYIGDRPITGLMRIKDQTYTLIGDVPFEQKYETTRLLATDNFPVDIEEDGETIKCVATINNDGTEVSKMEANSTLVVNAKPMFKNCTGNVMAPIGSEQFEIRCEFLSKPLPNSLQWKADVTGEIVRREDGENNGYTALMQNLDGKHRYEAILRIGLVGGSSFQPYTLSITNPEGNSQTTITLLEGDQGFQTDRGSAMTSALSVVMTIALALLLTMPL